MGQGSLKMRSEMSKTESTLQFEPGKKIVMSQKDSTQTKSEKGQASLNMLSLNADEELMQDLNPSRRTVPTVFHWEYGGREVYLSGSFNDWKTRIPMTYSAGEFTAIIELEEGEHQYKFLVDGTWVHDPNMPTSNDNLGGRNNLLVIRRSDFDIFQALDWDANDASQHSSNFRSCSPPGEYGQQIPSPNTPIILHDSLHSSVPPTLPPHLYNSTLNMDFETTDATFLPEPDHVTLNHLYALSIRDDVLSVSATHRYKRKYVTTLYYKPIKA